MPSACVLPHSGVCPVRAVSVRLYLGNVFWQYDDFRCNSRRRKVLGARDLRVVKKFIEMI